MCNSQHLTRLRNSLAIGAVAIGLIAGASLPAAARVGVAVRAVSVGHAEARGDVDCGVVGAISHRCYAFHSDATWREGLSDYHGSNGG